MSEQKQSSMRKWIGFVVLTLAAGVIFRVPYLRSIYYDSMIEAMNVNNTQLGALTSVYSIVKAVLYIPCGIIADKFNNRIMLTGSMLLLALCTFWYATLPGYGALQIIHVLLAISNGIFWVSFIKAIRLIGTEDEQGSMFGLSEGIRAVASIGLSFAGLAVLNAFMATRGFGALSYTLWFYGIIFVVLTVAIWFVTPNDTKGGAVSQTTLADYLKVLKVPGVWLVALLVCLAYSVQVISEYTTTYLSSVFGMTVVAAGVIGTIRSYVTGVFAAPIAGKIADKTGSPARIVAILLVIELAIALLYQVIPATNDFLYLTIAIVIAFSAFMYATRGIYYSTMGEAAVPVAMTGTAAGIISVIGYLPDVFVPPIVGNILDNNPGAPGFKMIFLMMAGFAVLAIIMAVVVFFIGRKLRENKAKEDAAPAV